MAVTVPNVRAPRPQQQGGLSWQQLQNQPSTAPNPAAPPSTPPPSGQIAPSSVASPPNARQTPTGGAMATQAGSVGSQVNPLVRAATRQVAGPGVGKTAPNGQSAKGNIFGLGGPLPSTPPQGSPDPGMPNTSDMAPMPTGGFGEPNPFNPAQQEIHGNPAPIPSNPYQGTPLDPTDEANRANALQAFGDAQSAYGENAYNAALAYGDPTQEARFGLAAPNPNSALALAALKAQQQTEADRNARGRNDTLFSSLAQEDLGRIGATQQRADLAGYQRYQAALAKFNSALNTAGSNYTAAGRSADADEAAKALANLTTPDQASGSAPAGTNNAGTTTPKGIHSPNVPKTGGKKGKGK